MVRDRAEHGDEQISRSKAVRRQNPPHKPVGPEPRFSRFNEEARAVVVTAQERARVAGNDTIGVGHLVLGVIAAADSIAAHCLTAQGLSLAEIERTAEATLPPAGATLPALVPFDPHAKTRCNVPS